MIWSIVMGTPATWKIFTGSGARPGAFRMAVFPKINVASGGSITDSPSVATTLMSVVERVRNRKRAK